MKKVLIFLIVAALLYFLVKSDMAQNFLDKLTRSHKTNLLQ